MCRRIRWCRGLRWRLRRLCRESLTLGPLVLGVLDSATTRLGNVLSLLAVFRAAFAMPCHASPRHSTPHHTAMP